MYSSPSWTMLWDCLERSVVLKYRDCIFKVNILIYPLSEISTSRIIVLWEPLKNTSMLFSLCLIFYTWSNIYSCNKILKPLHTHCYRQINGLKIHIESLWIIFGIAKKICFKLKNFAWDSQYQKFNSPYFERIWKLIRFLVLLTCLL